MHGKVLPRIYPWCQSLTVLPECRLSGFHLPGRIQHDHRSTPLATPPTGEVRQIVGWIGNQLTALSRAVDNQVFFGMCSPARDLGAGYHAVRSSYLQCSSSIGLTFTDCVQWGHSLMVDPMYIFTSSCDSPRLADLPFPGALCSLRPVTRKRSYTSTSVLTFFWRTRRELKFRPFYRSPGV